MIQSTIELVIKPVDELPSDGLPAMKIIHIYHPCIEEGKYLNVICIHERGFFWKSQPYGITGKCQRGWTCGHSMIVHSRYWIRLSRPPMECGYCLEAVNWDPIYDFIKDWDLP